MTTEELEQLKAEVEERMAGLRDLITETNDEFTKKIDKIYEDQLHKTLAAINKRLTDIEERLEGHFTKDDE